MRTSFLPLLLALSAAGCSDDPSTPSAAAAPAATDSSPAISDAAARQIEALVKATTPPNSSETPQAKSQWVRNRADVIEGLRKADAAVGRAALQEFRTGEHEVTDVQAALLDVAAHTAPEETAPLLAELTETYGPDPYVRGEAALLLAQIDPERALALLEPVLLEPDSPKTWPARETLLEACLAASRATGHDTSELLCAIAINIHQLDDVRHRAVRELGDEKGRRVELTLEEILVEPTGNAYLRRLAAQSLVRCMEREDACAIIARVADREADERFLLFLRDMLVKNCS